MELIVIAILILFVILSVANSFKSPRSRRSSSRFGGDHDVHSIFSGDSSLESGDSSGGGDGGGD